MGNQVLLILVDSGSSNSFLNAHMLSRVDCTVQDTTPIPIKLANGEFMQCDKMVPALSWWCQGETFTTSMRVLELGAYDAILGMDWLQQHSPMVTDCVNHCLAFPYNNKFVQLKGILAPQENSIRELPVEKLLKSYKGNEVWAMAIVRADEHISPAPIPLEVQEVLHKFPNVFDTPTALPPERQYDHTIPLKPDALAFNSRPYRYSPAHKDEIEKQVKKMLEACIIVHSMSPYASPVLLVQNKDGS